MVQDSNSVCLSACMWMAFAQLTDKMDPMYIIPKDPPKPHDDACVIFFSVSNFGHQGPTKLVFFCSSFYIIPNLSYFLCQISQKPEVGFKIWDKIWKVGLHKQNQNYFLKCHSITIYTANSHHSSNLIWYKGLGVSHLQHFSYPWLNFWLTHYKTTNYWGS